MAPTALKNIPEKENPLSPQSIGTNPPIVPPTNIPINMIGLEFITQV